MLYPNPALSGNLREDSPLGNVQKSMYGHAIPSPFALRNIYLLGNFIDSSPYLQSTGVQIQMM